MLVGMVFPQTEIGADRGGVRAWTQAAEELGFDHALIFDHVLGADTATRPDWTGPYTAETMFHEVMVVLAYMTAVAPGLGLSTSIVIAPQRQTALLAKQAAELAILTGDNFRLGVGLGWNEVEYEALGEDFRTRGRRLEEQIELMRLLWQEPVVNYEGRWDRVTAAGLNPLPPRGQVPIWIGAAAEPAVKRAARLADGLFLAIRRSEPDEPAAGTGPIVPHRGYQTVEDTAAYVEQVRGWVVEAGRDPGSFGLQPRINAHGADQGAWRQEADEWRSLGVTHLSVNVMGDGLSGADEHMERLRLVAEALL